MGPHIQWPALSTFGEILAREGLTASRGRRKSRACPHEALPPEAPNDVWGADYKGHFYTTNRTRCDPLTITDSYSRMILCCMALSPPISTREVQEIFIALFREHGLPLVIKSNNGAPFAATGLGLTRLSVWWIQLGSSSLAAAAMRSAERASSVSMRSDIAQPTTRREYRSSRTARNNQPSVVAMYVMSPASTRLGARTVKLRSKRLGAMRFVWRESVVFRKRRGVCARSPRSRIIRATRFLLGLDPRRCSARRTRGALRNGEKSHAMEFLNELQSAAFWVGLWQIILVNIVLSGDNAVVIALAARSLPPKQQKQAVFWGAGAAVVMRIILTVVAVELLRWPWLKLVGAALLLWIAVKLLLPENGEDGNVESSDNLWAAIKTILIADLVMSLDNVIAVAAAAKGSLVLLVLGLWTRPAALVIAFNMVMAIYLSHAKDVLKLSERGGSWAIETPMFFLLTAVAVAILGAGRYSVGGRDQ